MELPDILGFELDEALSVLAEKDIQVQDIKTTKPVKECLKQNKARVVRITQGNWGDVRVVIAY